MHWYKDRIGWHWKYLWYVLRHKWFVFLACWQFGVPLWPSLIHDWQKFTPAEWRPYVLNFFGPWKRDDRPTWLVQAFDRAWLHHLHYGPHHWEYWILRGQPLAMPDRYRREMLADWQGAGRAIAGKDDSREFYLKRRDKIDLHPETRAWVEIQLEIISDSWFSQNE